MTSVFYANLNFNFTLKCNFNYLHAFLSDVQMYYLYSQFLLYFNFLRPCTRLELFEWCVIFHLFSTCYTKINYIIIIIIKDRQTGTDRDRNTETNRQTETEIQIQTDRQGQTVTDIDRKIESHT